MRTTFPKLDSREINYNNMNVGTHVHPLKDANTLISHTHSLEAVGQTHNQDWAQERALLQVGFGVLFFL